MWRSLENKNKIHLKGNCYVCVFWGEVFTSDKNNNKSVSERKVFCVFKLWCILGFRAKWKQRKCWETSSSLSRVDMEVSISEALFPPLHSCLSYGEKVPPKTFKILKPLKMSAAPSIWWHPEASKILVLFVSPAKQFPFVYLFLFSSMQMDCKWWMLKSFQVLSSTEQQSRCLSSRLCVHTSIYISISHLKCWNKWMF